MLKSLVDRMKQVGYQELAPLSDTDQETLLTALLANPDIRRAAEACATEGTTIDTLSAAIEPVVRISNPDIDGYQFFNLVVEVVKRASKAQ